MHTLFARTIAPSLVRSVTASICIISLMTQSGCALFPSKPPPPPSEVTRANFGTIGVVPARFLPEPVLQLPAKGGLAGAGRGAANWSAAGAAVPLKASGGGGGTGAILILAASVVGATLGGLAGTVAGAAKSETAEKVRISEAALRSAIDSLKPQESLLDRFVQVAQEEARQLLVVVSGEGPVSPDEKIRYGFLAQKGIDTVVELAVTDFGVNGVWDINPPLWLIMKSRVRVVRTADDRELYTASFEYAGGERTFCEWAADSAGPFRAELDRAYRALAEKYVEEIFLLYPFPAAVNDVH